MHICVIDSYTEFFSERQSPPLDQSTVFRLSNWILYKRVSIDPDLAPKLWLFEIAYFSMRNSSMNNSSNKIILAKIFLKLCIS